MKYISTTAVLILLFAGVSHPLFAQPLLSGPVCVVPGIVYQYEVNSRWDSVSPAHICVSGGLLNDSSSSCMDAVALPYLRITWTNTESGTITAHLPDGDTTFTVDLTTSLQAGDIDTLSEFQLLDTLTTPSSIQCHSASGGSCAPQYEYLWQQSEDGINWTDVSGASGQSMTFSSPLQHSTYFRRRVKDLASGTIAYSNVSAVFIS